jgi:hypothetical protein
MAPAIACQERTDKFPVNLFYKSGLAFVIMPVGSFIRAVKMREHESICCSICKVVCNFSCKSVSVSPVARGSSGTCICKALPMPWTISALPTRAPC